jgi:hypothetical protein
MTLYYFFLPWYSVVTSIFDFNLPAGDLLLRWQIFHCGMSHIHTCPTENKLEVNPPLYPLQIS